MQRTLPYLGAVLALLVAGGWLAFRANTREVIIVRPIVPLEIATTTSPAEEKVIAVAKVNDPPPSEADTARASERLRSALVNIFCLATRESGVSSISASGVVVSPAGHILTNAHVGQYFLFADRGVECTIRTGSPAKAAYKADLVYLSPIWVARNPRTFLAEAPVGTGEHDIAILVLTEALLPKAEDASLGYTPLASGAPETGRAVLLGSYAAQYLNSEALEHALYPTLLAAYVQKLFTFGDDVTDLFTVRGSGAAQEGASGGGVVSMRGELLGLITTSKTSGSPEDRFVTALSSGYIRREYKEQEGHGLDALLSQPPAAAIEAFASMKAALQQTLENEIDRR